MNKATKKEFWKRLEEAFPLGEVLINAFSYEIKTLHVIIRLIITGLSIIYISILNID